MPQYKIFFCLFLLFAQLAFGQTRNIDSISSDADVETLMHSFGRFYQNFQIKAIAEFKEQMGDSVSCKCVADSLNITKAYYKADFDNNGLTDMLVTGGSGDVRIFIVMNLGNDSLKLHGMPRRSYGKCVFARIVNGNQIEYYDYKFRQGLIIEGSGTLTKTTLVYKSGAFIELNEHPKRYNIEKIEFDESSPWLNPVFKLVITKKRRATFDAKYHNIGKRSLKIEDGEYMGQIDKGSYNALINLLNYIDFPILEDSYWVNWTDDPTSTLRITYNNGQVKEIEDYGMVGTCGLREVYRQIGDLRFSQKWRKQ
ncbi:DUF6438 domain-containing protein [Pedobacter faecalis]|uniref:DUF6438 domain-containing protein n=1 Tax=Pedobacter faecalis TaxID=3041495 RepID=UPI002550B492|nr:DUF6438 domain-containing protein [Pedobacter sp. ELA7]